MSILCFFIGAAMGVAVTSILAANSVSRWRDQAYRFQVDAEALNRAYHDLAAKNHQEGEGWKE